MLEAIYGDDLQHDEGESTNATELAAHLAALEVNATEAATIPVRALGLHASAHYGARPPLPTGTLARLASNGLSTSKGDAALHALASHAARSGELSDCILIAF